LKGTVRQPGEELKKSFTGATGAINEVKMSAKQLDNEIRAVTESMRKTNDPKATAALKEYRQELIAEESQLGKTTQKFESMRGKIMAIKNELFKMSAEGKQRTARFQELSTELGRLGNMKDDINELGKAVSSDTRHIDGMIQGVQGLVGAFSIFQGVQMLVGSENEDFQKAMLKMMATMQVLNGVQQVANILQKESAFRQTLQTVASKIFTQQKIIETTVTQGATEAQIALNAAVVANPFGIAAVAAIALVAGVIAIAEANENKLTPSQKAANAELEKTKELLPEIKEAYENNVNFYKSINATQESILANDLEFNKKSKAANWDRINLLLKLGSKATDEQEKELTQRFADDKEYGKKINELEAGLKAISNQNFKKANQLRLENMRDGLAKEKALIIAKYEDDVYQAGSNEDLKRQLLISKNKQIAEVTKKYNDQAKKLRKEDAEKHASELAKRLENEKKFEQSMLDFKKAIKEKQKALPDFDAENLKSRMNEQKEYNTFVLENDKASLEDKKTALKSNVELIYLEELENAKSLRNRKEAWDKYQSSLTEIENNERKKRNEKTRKEIEQYVNSFSQAINIVLQYEQQANDKKLLTITEIYDSQIKKNQEALDKGLISQEQFDKKSKELQEKKTREENKIKHKQFEVDRAGKLIEATINLGLAISQAYTKEVTGIMAAINAVLIGAQIGLIAGQKNPYRKGTAQILSGNSHEGGGISLGQFGTAEGGEMLGILSKKNTKRFGKPMLELFDGINKGNDSKMMKGLSGLVISAMPEIRQGNQVVNVPKHPELAEMLTIMKQPAETTTIIGNKKIIKKGNYTRIVHL
jgi:hypothetical protein